MTCFTRNVFEVFLTVLTAKSLQFQTSIHPHGFFKIKFPRDSIKPCFFITFNITINYVFNNNCIKIIKFNFLIYLCFKKYKEISI